MNKINLAMPEIKEKSLWMLFLLFTAAQLPVQAQQYLDINLGHKCIFHGNTMDEELYAFSSDVDVMDKLVAKILADGGGLEKNFTIVQTNVENVSAVVDGDKRYLLWSQDYIAEASRIEAYASTSHEVGHLVNTHTFRKDDGQHTAHDASFFMGFILAKAGFPKDEVKRYLRQTQYQPSCAGSSTKNEEQVLKGYDKAENLLKYKSIGNFEEDPSLINFQKAAFPFPPPECHTSYELAHQTFANCFTLGQVAKKIKQSLDVKGFPNKYMSVPNGFAIVSQMEQYNGDGSIMAGSANRWTEIPPHESFSLTWSYFKSLLYPRKGHLRLFVFIVTNQNYNSDKKMVSRKDAASWLSQAVNRLPKQIASETFNSDYSVSCLVYEFEVPESNHRVKQSCPTRYQAKDHLKLSGLLGLLKR